MVEEEDVSSTAVVVHFDAAAAAAEIAVADNDAVAANSESALAAVDDNDVHASNTAVAAVVAAVDIDDNIKVQVLLGEKLQLAEPGKESELVLA